MLTKISITMPRINVFSQSKFFDSEDSHVFNSTSIIIHVHLPLIIIKIKRPKWQKDLQADQRTILSGIMN